jgi:hypothetical protein
MHFAGLHLVMSDLGPLLAALWKVSQCLRTEKMRLHMQRRNTRSRSRHTVRLCLYMTALSKQQSGQRLDLQSNSSIELCEKLIKFGSKNVFLGRLCHPPLMGVFKCQRMELASATT